MALPYPRKFNAGRGSELLYNEQLHKDFETTKHILDMPGDDETPKTQLSGALWMKRSNGTNHLKTWVKDKNQWVDIFADKFQITDQILNTTVPGNPVRGQLWLYHGLLCYYDGQQWHPVKAESPDGSQFDLNIFSNFLMLSPLWHQGNVVLNDQDIQAYIKTRRDYLQGKIDYQTDSEYISDGTKWKPGDANPIKNDIAFPDEDITGACQFVVPHLKYERVFIDDKLDHNYQQESETCIQYDRKYLINDTPNGIVERRPSLIHVNPSYLCGISKKLFHIDHSNTRENPRIPVPAHNTEYYGFHKDDRHGHLLLPEDTQDDGGYIVDRNAGIILSWKDAQNYDYVLAVTYEFSDTRPNGFSRHKDNQSKESSYYSSELDNIDSIFVDGLNLEELDFDEDSNSKTITIAENTSGQDIQVIKSGLREYGFVREMTLDKKAKIHLLREYDKPMVFVNGEAMNPAVNEISYDKTNNEIEVTNARMNMAWSVIDLYDTTHPVVDADGDFITLDGQKARYKITTNLANEEVKEGPYTFTVSKSGAVTFDESKVVDIKYYDMMDSEGLVTDLDEATSKAVIKYNNDDVEMKDILDDYGNKIGSYPDHIVLFVDGLLVKQSDLIVDTEKKTVTTPWLRQGQDYILLKDKYDKLVGSLSLLPALETGKLSESMVYHNGYLLGNLAPISTGVDKDIAALSAGNHQVMCFVGKTEATQHQFMEFDASTSKWTIMSNKDAGDVYYIMNSYQNMPRTVSFNFDWNPVNDLVDVYSFNFANDIEHTLVIRNLPSEYDDPIFDPFNTENNNGYEKTVDTDGKILPTGMLSGDAPEVAPNMIHYFESDIKKKIAEFQKDKNIMMMFPTDTEENRRRSTVEIRKYALRQLNKLPMYSTVWYHEFSMTGGEVKDKYVPGIGSLCVYVNGVRQYDVKEINSQTFAIPWPVRGMVTYTVELPENGNTSVASREIIGKDNIVGNSINIYHCETSLYPGRPAIYIDGVRQPQDCFTIIDSHTLMFNDATTKLIGNKNNYPDEYIIDTNGNTKQIHHTQDDRILIEMFQDYRWIEEHANMGNMANSYNIKLNDLGLSPDMLKSQDEFKIYIDGLFLGLKNNEGYRRDTIHEMIGFMRPDVLNVIQTDPLYAYLVRHPEDIDKWREEVNQRMVTDYINSTYNVTEEDAIRHLKELKLYDPDPAPESKDLIIEWR